MKKIIIISLLIFIFIGGVFAESDALNQITSKLIDYMENTEAFLTEQTPEYIEQLLVYKVYSLKIWLIFIIILIIIGFYIDIYLLIRAIKEDDNFYIGVFFTLIICLALISIFINIFNDIKQIELAPKVYILNYLMTLGK